MKLRKYILSGILAAAMLCGSVFGSGAAGYMEVRAAAGNVALGKTVTVSEVDSQTPTMTGDKAVDGISNTDGSRWSGGVCQAGEPGDADQWLVIDLAAANTTVESIKVYFHKLVWSRDYTIQTRSSEQAAWEDVYRVQTSVSDRADSVEHPIDTIAGSHVSALKKYVRFLFKAGSLNAGAAGSRISIREIEIYGEQSGQDAPTTAAGALSLYTSSDFTPDDTAHQLTIADKAAVTGAYNVTIHGSEVDKIVGDDGKLSPYRLEDRTFNLIVQAVNKTNTSDTGKKNISVTIPNNRSAYPALFPAVANPNPVPQVLPTIQEWYGYEGAFQLKDSTKIIVNDAANKGLMDVAKEMQTDIRDICKKTLAIETGTAAGTGNIYLESLAQDTYGTGEEGYFLVNNDVGIKISSSTKTGVLYGTVTVEQILWQDSMHQTVPKGIIRDYPLYGTRGIMFDVARIPTRLQFLKDYSKIFKWYKLNTLQIHLNDNQWPYRAKAASASWDDTEASHRLESELFPSLAKQRSKFPLGEIRETNSQGQEVIKYQGDYEGRYDYYFSTHTGSKEAGGGELYYTKEEYRQLEKVMGDRGIELVPELDTPGHSAAYNKYVYNNQQEAITSLVNKGYLNRDTYLNADGTVKKNFYIHNPADFELLSIDESGAGDIGENARNAKIFMTALFDEYLGGIDGIDPVFTTDRISAGVDEYWLKTDATRTAFAGYLNHMYNLLGDSDTGVTQGKKDEGYGKDVLIWGAFKQFPVSNSVSKNLTIELWNCEAGANGEDDPIARLNEGFNLINIPQPFLYTTPARNHKDMLNEVYVYYKWDPARFRDDLTVDKGEPQLKGAMGALWGDENREGITEADLHERYLRLAAMISEKDWGGTKDGAKFLQYEQTFDRLKEGPGTQIANQIESKTNVVLNYNFDNVSADKKKIYDASGNGYDGTITGGEIVTKDNEKMLKFGGSTKIETPLTTLDIPYTMSFDIYLDSSDTNDKNAALFSGYDGRLFVSGSDGKLGLNRDYFTQSFDYAVEKARKQRITIVGTYQATKLYVDGQFQKILYAAASDPDHDGAIGASTWTDKDNNFRSTFVFPLNKIGENLKGCLGNIKAYNKALSIEELAAESSGTYSMADVARNRPAYSDNKNPAFYTDGIRLFPAWKATDGDGHVTGIADTTASVSYESRWNSSDNNGDFLMVDLGRERKVSKVVIDWEKNRYAAAYKIMTSVDGKNWNEVKSVTGNTASLTEDVFTETQARYVKMQGVTRKSGANEYAIYEIKVYEAVNKSDLKTKIEAAQGVLSQENIGLEAADAAKSLKDSVVLAQAVYTDVMAGQAETDEAAAALPAAVVEYYYSGMKKQLDASEEILAKKTEYDQTKESWTKFETAYRQAKDAADSLSTEKYKTLADALKDAIGKLEKAQPPVQQPAGQPPAQQPSADPKPGEQKETPIGNVTIGEQGTVALTTGDKNISSKLTVGKVAIAGKEYAVTVIAQDAFAGGKMNAVTVEDSVETIGKNAFANCKKVKTVVLGKNIKSIESGAFRKCTRLKTLTFKGTSIPKIAKNAFSGTKVTKVIAPKSLKKNNKFWTMLKKAGIKVKK